MVYSGTVTGVFTTDTNIIPVIKEAIARWIGPKDIEGMTTIDQPPPGYNPFQVTVNMWEGFLVLTNGQSRRFRQWIPDADFEAKATIVLLHGYGDHSQRYHHVAKYFCDQGFQVVAIDQKFHGDN